MSDDIDDAIIDRIRELYEGQSNIERVLLVLISNSNADSERLLRMLRRSLGDDEAFRDVCDQAYAAHGGAVERAAARALPEEGNRQALRRIDRAINQVELILKNDSLRAAIYGVDAMAGSVFIFIPLVLGAQVGIAIYRYRKGDITGEEAAERVASAFLDFVGAGGGLVAGAAVGGILGPVGAAAGGTIGVMVGTMVASRISKMIMRRFFEGTGDESLNRAYRYFGLSYTASNQEINGAYQSKCLETNPSRPGGSNERQLECDAYMATIRVSRGDNFGQA